MDYKKKYTDLIERLHKAMDDDNVNDDRYCCVIKNIVPELAESERISKALIRLIRQCGEGYENVTEGVSIPEAIAWLEKQGEKRTNSEPKFKEGDIVKHSHFSGLYYRVKSIDLSGDYELECLNGAEGDNIAAATEDCLSLWTIQDAKAGDVLANENSIILFRGIGNERWDDVIDYYAVLYKTNDFTIQRGISYWGTTKETDLKPATKEQHACLFQKMHEAGYEWDAEKLELRKLGMRTVDLGKVGPAEWSEEDKQYLLVCKNALAKYQKTDHWDAMIISAWLEDKVRQAISQPRQEWSEEDEKMMKAVIEDIHCGTDFNAEVIHEANKREDWLKTLKDRVAPQPKQGEKDIPHWKKSTLPNDNVTGFNSDFFSYNGYCINYKELFDRLPKED